MDAPALEMLPLAVPRFVPYIGVPVARDSGEFISMPMGAQCPYCCHWALPLELAPRPLPHGVALTYLEWLVYHWHLQTHQRGVPVS